jgi:hypothetical protein
MIYGAWRHLRVPNSICGYLDGLAGTPEAFPSLTPRGYFTYLSLELQRVPASTRIPAHRFILKSGRA